jgi:hypothetical protein
MYPNLDSKNRSSQLTDQDIQYAQAMSLHEIAEMLKALLAKMEEKTPSLQAPFESEVVPVEQPKKKERVPKTEAPESVATANE